MILLLDNFDSFTYNLVDYLNQLEISVQVIRNDEPLENFIRNKFEGVVLSPGPERPEQSGNLLKVIEYYYDKVPILGICLGHQAIGCFFGAKIQKANIPMHGKLSEIETISDPLFKGIPSKLNIVRYHSLILSNLPETLKTIAISEKNEIMAIRHISYKIWGVQFHPEAYLSEYGIKLLENWIYETI